MTYLPDFELPVNLEGLLVRNHSIVELEELRLVQYTGACQRMGTSLRFEMICRRRAV